MLSFAFKIMIFASIIMMFGATRSTRRAAVGTITPGSGFAFKLMNFAFKMTNLAFKMMNLIQTARFKSYVKGSTSFAKSTGKTQNYGFGGYAVELPRDHAGAVAVLSQMERDFVGPSTRAVAVSFNVYNVNTDIFLIFQASFAFHPTGHIEPFSRITPVQLMDNFFFAKEAYQTYCFFAMFSITIFFFVGEVQ